MSPDGVLDRRLPVPGAWFVSFRRSTRLLCGSALVVVLGLVATGTPGDGNDTDAGNILTNTKDQDDINNWQ